MIPRKLRLRGFMCYREEQTLDFSGMHMTSLTGDNGHGKSALLDAITWVLWGRARARRDDELITLGETDMWVDLEFSLGPQVYRVTRQRSKKGRGQSDLHFYIWNPSGDDWQLLDEGNLLQRQAQIIRTLRLDYETFVNSAFLLQGRADSFTVKTPMERKQILADILGLSRYDRYEERAKEQVQARKERTLGIEAELKSIDAELAHREEYAERLNAAAHAVEQAVAALRLAEAEQGQARAQVQGLRGLQAQLDDLRARMARGEQELADLRAQLGKAQARLKALEDVLAQRAEIEAGWQQLGSAREAEARWNSRLVSHSQLQDKLNAAQRAVDQARADLVAEQRRLQAQAAELQSRATAVEGHRLTLAQVQALLAEMAEQQARREAIATELREVIEAAAGLRHEVERVKAEGQAVKERLALLHESEDAVCPVCNQSLSPEHREHAEQQLAAERDALAERFRDANARIKELSVRKASLEAEDRELARGLHTRDARQRQAAQTETLVADGEAAAAQLPGVAEQLAQVEARLAGEDYGGPVRDQLSRILAAMADTGYDGQAHAAARGEVERLMPYDAAYQRQLLPALEGLGEVQGRCESLAGQVARRTEELAEDQARRAELEAAVAELPRTEAALRQADAQVQAADQASRRAQQQQGAAQQQLDALDRLVERRDALREQLDALNAEIGIYTELRAAFGKKGIQAMIIESAIPEVETEANRLLQRMSEGRMNVRLETQREKVTGGVAETLDIIIGDELGSRAYELFSGGEGFRANLALRIALSKLLARRAGAQLQTLIIDEGFGSQDTRGLSLVVETINSIKDDFQLIVVISHIEELKDQFGARIDVVKQANGSRVAVA